MSSAVGLWHTPTVLSSTARTLAFSALCLVCASSLARAQVIDSPLDSEEAEEEGLPFRGSTFGFVQSLSGNSFFKDTQLSFNPAYSWGFSLDLYWHFNSIFQVGLNQELEVELTDSDTTTLQREPLLADTAVTFTARMLRGKHGSDLKWLVNGTGTLLAPTSLASQAATMVLGTKVGATGSLTLTKVMSGLGFNASVGYLHRWMTQNVAQVEESYPCNAGSTSRALCSQTGGTTNTRYSVTLGVGADLALNDKWGVSLAYSHVFRRAADLADDDTLRTIDGTRILLSDGTNKHWRNRNTLDIGVSYAVLPWLGLGASVSNLFEERGPDGELRPPFKPADTSFGLDVTLKLDELYLATHDTGASE